MGIFWEAMPPIQTAAYPAYSISGVKQQEQGLKLESLLFEVSELKQLVRLLRRELLARDFIHLPNPVMVSLDQKVCFKKKKKRSFSFKKPKCFIYR